MEKNRYVFGKNGEKMRKKEKNAEHFLVHFGKLSVNSVQSSWFVEVGSLGIVHRRQIFDIIWPDTFNSPPRKKLIFSFSISHGIVGRQYDF